MHKNPVYQQKYAFRAGLAQAKFLTSRLWDVRERQMQSTMDIS